jgi:REP-associated tyrosine transposase
MSGGQSLGHVRIDRCVTAVPSLPSSIVRKPRNVLPASGIYHVTSRGVAYCNVFQDDTDRRLFLARLRRLAAELDLRCILYCLMTTHYHLLTAGSLGDLSKAMQRLQGAYAQQFNAKYARVGHLFQERFFAKAVLDDVHFENAYAYICNNPVEAGLCATPADWPWTGSM